MNEFQQYLSDSGARKAGFAAPPTLALVQDGFVAAIHEASLIAANGLDAVKFLHNQLTNDVQHLAEPLAAGVGKAQLAAYCSPKGRLLTTMLMWQSADTVWLQLPAELAAPIQKRLSMYVLRDKVKLQAVAGNPDFPMQQVTLGLGGQAAGTALANWFPHLPPHAYSLCENTHGTLIRVGDAFGAARYLWLCSEATAAAAWPQLAGALAPLDERAWDLSAIHAGVPQLSLPTQEKFVPQMINFELIGGVNFKKGCYPGQEIVARSQYLGTLKRRMMLAKVAATAVGVVPGAEIFSSSDPAQPCGTVVNAQATQDEGLPCWHLLTEIKLAARQAGSVHLGSADGPPLQWLELPYALDAIDV